MDSVDTNAEKTCTFTAVTRVASAKILPYVLIINQACKVLRRWGCCNQV